MPAALSRPTVAPPADPWRLDCRGRVLDLRPGRAHVMGVLNVTPDSFSDGGSYGSVQEALDRAGAMADDGATIVDVGGESTRPGAPPVGLAEEVERVVPVIEALARALPHVLISVDTYKGPVAREALRAGAHLVNDVAGLRDGVGTAAAAAAYHAPLIVMHAPARTGGAPAPGAGDRDIVDEVTAGLRQSVRRALAAGVQHVVVDAGFGFGKSAEENLRLVAETDRLRAALGRPVLVGVSRKSTVGAVLGGPGGPRPVGERLHGSLGLAVLAALRGASIVRAHDVRPTVDALQIVRAAEAARRSDGG